MRSNILSTGLLIIVFAAAVAVAGAQIAKDVAEDAKSSQKTIKGAPFSADSVTESVQILSDGTRITRRTTTKLYRDSEGRYRREENRKQLGVSGDTVEISGSIVILDPVSGSRYELNVEDRTYKRSNFKFAGPMNLFKNSGPLKMEVKDGEWKINNDKKADVKIESNSSSSQSSSSQSSHNGAPPLTVDAAPAVDGNEAEARGKRAEVRGKEAEARAKELEKRHEKIQEQADKLAEEEAKSNSARKAEIKKQIKELENEGRELEKQYKALEKQAKEDQDLFKPRSTTEQLAAQNIEGLEAEGTRTTTIIPAGSIGNDRDIKVVYEKWYSKELQMTILSKHNDPRFGEQTYRLSNINRDNPPLTLFSPPQDFADENADEDKNKDKAKRVNIPRVSVKPVVSKTPKPAVPAVKKPGDNEPEKPSL